jgi:nucleoside-diphosphate-sugar epimerase
MGTVLISGASGFIAQNAAAKARKAGFRTIGISHSTRSLPLFDEIYSGSLSHPLEGVFKEGIDVFIHCAYDSGREDYTLNVEGTQLWAKQAAKEGVKHQVFLSSISARADSPSSYSRAKHALENWFDAQGFTVLRLGLVLGKGGLFQRMTTLVKKMPIVPLLDGGRAPVYVAGMQEVCRVLLLVMEQESWVLGNTWNLFQSEPFCLREILEEIKKQHEARCLFFPVPSKLALGLVGILERIPLVKIGITSNNIVGLRQNVAQEWNSDYDRFGLNDISLERLIAQTLDDVVI